MRQEELKLKPWHVLGDAADSARKAASVPGRLVRERSGRLVASDRPPHSAGWQNARCLKSRQTSNRNRPDLHDTSLAQGHDPEKEAGLQNRLARPPCCRVGKSSMQQARGATNAADTWSSAACTRPVHEASPELLKVEEHRETTRYYGPGASHAKPASTGQQLKVKSGVGIFGRESTDQLERFLQAIGNADSRFVNTHAKHLQSRLCILDCQLQHGVSQLLGRRVQYQLALILQRRDPWELRLQAVEKFVQEHGILPRCVTTMPQEQTLATWLRHLCCDVKKRSLTATRMQKLLDSSCGKLRARVEKWLDPETPFERLVKKLREFVRVHHRMPVGNRAPKEHNLAANLLQSMLPRRKDRERRLQILEQEGPIVAKWVASERTRHPRLKLKRWRPQLEKLVEFLNIHGRMPQSGSIERPVYLWVLSQRKQLDRLPADLRAQLFNSHPAVANFLQS